MQQQAFPGLVTDRDSPAAAAATEKTAELGRRRAGRQAWWIVAGLGYYGNNDVDIHRSNYYQSSGGWLKHWKKSVQKINYLSCGVVVELLWAGLVGSLVYHLVATGYHKQNNNNKLDKLIQHFILDTSRSVLGAG